MNKNELITSLRDVTGVNEDDVENVIDALAWTIVDRAHAGESITIAGFLKIEVVEKAERQGRNPQTGETITLAPKRAVRIKPTGVYAQRIEGKRPNEL